MTPLNWGVPLTSQDANPGDLVTCTLRGKTVIGMLCEDTQGQAIIVLAGGDNLELCPMLINIDQFETDPSKLAGQPIFAALEEQRAFLVQPQNELRNGQLIALQDGTFAISLVQASDRYVFAVSTGNPSNNTHKAPRFSEWRLLLKLDDKHDPIEIYNSNMMRGG